MHAFALSFSTEEKTRTKKKYVAGLQPCRVTNNCEIFISSCIPQMFDDIATARHPKAEYTNSDWGTVGFFFLLGMLPTSFGDKARIALMRLPM